MHQINKRFSLATSPLQGFLKPLYHHSSYVGVFVHHQVPQPPVQIGRDTAVQHGNIRRSRLLLECLPPFPVIRGFRS